MAKTKRTICVDFDGVINAYRNGYGAGEFDEPIEGSIQALVRLLKRGYNVVILTARENHREIEDYIANHMRELNFNEFTDQFEVTNVKPVAIAYIDDRAVRFTTWADMLNYF